MHLQIKELEYNYIADGIYIGTNQCCQTHFDERLKKREGIEADISLEEEEVDAPFGVKFYVWLPVKNRFPPSPDQFEFGVQVLQKWVQMSKKVYLHCQNGHSRAPTLMAAYLMKTRGMNVDKAVKFIHQRRPAIHLEVRQMESLEEFQAGLISDL